MTEPLIRLRGLHCIHGSGEASAHVLRGIDLDIMAGEFVAIIGASGSGKSTLMNILGLLDRPSAGTYHLAGRDTASLTPAEQSRLRGGLFGFVFQQYHLIAGLSARENVDLPAAHAGMPSASRRKRAADLLVSLGLGARLDAKPARMSGGQQQRVSIARALMNGGAILLADEPTGALDHESGAEVMRLLTRLAAEGHTLILITHDAEVAAAANRVIRIVDGQIAEDSGAGQPADLPPMPPARGSGIASSMREAAKSALAALLASPVRTALTLGGIVIGVASVVAMMAIGRGAQEEFLARASATGTDWVVVLSDQETRMPRRPLTLGDAEAMKEIPNVAAVTVGRWEQVSIRNGGREIASDIVGTNGDFQRVHGWTTAQGSFFDEQDERAASPVLALGATVAQKLFPDQPDPTGEFVLVNNTPFLVTGVMEAKGLDEDGEDRDAMAAMPLTSLESRLYGTGELSGIVVALDDMSLLDTSVALVRDTLTERHGAEDFWLYDAASAFQTAQDARTSQNLLLGAMAAISILVGGIGVMNIMFITVRERTREIGIRTAVGASRRDVMIQFLVEAVVLAALGGIAGLAIAGAIGTTAAYGFGMPVIFSISVAGAALAGAVLMGALFGIMPAHRAAGLSPVEALVST